MCFQVACNGVKLFLPSLFCMTYFFIVVFVYNWEEKESDITVGLKNMKEERGS